MNSEKSISYLLFPISCFLFPVSCFLLCFSSASAQETGADDEKVYAEMMEDVEFQKFLRITGEAFSPVVKTEPEVQGETDSLSLYWQLRRQQAGENERNRDTFGYKRREYDFHIPYKQPQQSQPQQSQPQQSQPQQPLSVAVKIDMRQGELRETGDDFDLAIEGNGFFRVVDQTGSLEEPQILYTRCGSFERDGQGFLSLLQGDRVFRLTPEIFVPEEFDTFHVSEDGQIHATTETESDEQTIGRLELAVFPNPKRLRPTDDRCFSETPLSGKPKIRCPAQGTAGKIRQRFLEESNVRSEIIFSFRTPTRRTWF